MENRRSFLAKAAAAGVAALSTPLWGQTARGGKPAEPSAPKAAAPNLILITCHDLGRHLGCYGIPTVSTPHLDAFAAEGVRFSRAFCVAPQCSPSRATLVTGQYPASHGVLGLAHGLFDWTLNPDCRPIAKVLKAAGWDTALAGGQHETHDPRQLGFDLLASEGLFRPCEETTDLATNFLQAASRREGRPFYLQIGYHEPHRPFDWGGAKPDQSKGITVPPYLVDSASARAECAGIQGSIRAMDAAVGRLLATIDQLQLRDNTVVVFTTDHGIAFPRAKCALYDPGLEVCLMMRWPGGRWSANGRTDDTILSNVDVLPTLLELVGVPAPSQVEGRSFAALLRGQPYTARSAIFGQLTYHDYFDPRRSVRTETHKLIVNFSNAYFFMDPSQEWFRGTVTRSPADPAYAYHPPVELYDLRADPGEITNLADEPAQAATRKELMSRLRAWMDATKDPLLTGIPISPMHRRALAALTAG